MKDRMVGILACALVAAEAALAGSVKGIVADAVTSSSLPGIRVAVQVVIPDSIELVSMSDVHGAYQVAEIPSGNQIYVITVYAPGYASYYFRYDELGTGDRTVDILLQPSTPPPPGGGDSTNVSGVVSTEISPTGTRQPLQGAILTLTSGGVRYVTQTDGQGKYAVRVRVGYYTVAVSRTGYQALTAQGISAESEGLTLAVNLKSASTTVSRRDVGSGLVQYRLSAAYPNPFNPQTTIEFSVPVRSRIELKVFNLLGEEVVTLADGEAYAGLRSVVFHAGNLPSGVYLYRLIAQPLSMQQDVFAVTGRVLLAK